MVNPVAGTRGYARLSNLVMAPAVRLLPFPRGFALLTVTGRRSAKLYSRPVRASRGGGDRLYVVAMMGERSDWLRNIRKNPRVLVRLGRDTLKGRAREVADRAEKNKAGELYEGKCSPSTIPTTLGTSGAGRLGGRSRPRTGGGLREGSWSRSTLSSDDCGLEAAGLGVLRHDVLCRRGRGSSRPTLCIYDRHWRAASRSTRRGGCSEGCSDGIFTTERATASSAAVIRLAGICRSQDEAERLGSLCDVSR